MSGKIRTVAACILAYIRIPKTMNTDLSSLLGYPAAFLTTVAFVPQACGAAESR